MKTNEDFVLRDIYGRYILMPIRFNRTSSDPILLNEVAVSIWNMVAVDRLEKRELMKGIAQQYDLKPASTEWIAVEQFIEQMEEIGLLTT